MSNRRDATQKDPARDAFWYRRTFRFDQPVPAVARLKVHKAMFGSRIVLNGQQLGDHAPNHTPGYFDARAALRQGENVLLIRVGADRGAVDRGGIEAGITDSFHRFIDIEIDAAGPYQPESVGLFFFSRYSDRAEDSCRA